MVDAAGEFDEGTWTVYVYLVDDRFITFNKCSFATMQKIMDSIANSPYYRAKRTLVMSAHVVNISAIKETTDA